MNSIIYILENMTEEIVLDNFLKRQDSSNLNELFYVLSMCNDNTKQRWYNALRNMLKSMQDELVLIDYLKRQNFESLLEIFDLLDSCDENTQDRWHTIYSSLFFSLSSSDKIESLV